MRARHGRIYQKQLDTLATARRWARGENLTQFRRSVIEAARYHPISTMQWFHLRQIVGEEVVRELRRFVETIRG